MTSTVWLLCCFHLISLAYKTLCSCESSYTFRDTKKNYVYTHVTPNHPMFVKLTHRRANIRPSRPTFVTIDIQSHTHFYTFDYELTQRCPDVWRQCTATCWRPVVKVIRCVVSYIFYTNGQFFHVFSNNLFNDAYFNIPIALSYGYLCPLRRSWNVLGWDM